MWFDLDAYEKRALKYNLFELKIRENDLNTLSCIGIDNDLVLFPTHNQREPRTNKSINAVDHWSRVVVSIHSGSYSASLKRLQI